MVYYSYFSGNFYMRWAPEGWVSINSCLNNCDVGKGRNGAFLLSIFFSLSISQSTVWMFEIAEYFFNHGGCKISWEYYIKTSRHWLWHLGIFLEIYYLTPHTSYWCFITCNEFKIHPGLYIQGIFRPHKINL